MDIRTIQLKKTILENNDKDADFLRQQMREQGTFYVNVMSSPGSGKTTMLVSTIKLLQKLDESLKIGVMEADIDSDVDAQTIYSQTGAPAVQLHTGGMCHLDADMSRQALREIGSENLDIVILENVGNLVCPAEFDTGAQINLVILSVPEGDDKPLKYPLMFSKADVVVLNKIDTMEVFDFSPGSFMKNLTGCCPDAPVFMVSAATGEGIIALSEWLGGRAREILEYIG